MRKKEKVLGRALEEAAIEFDFGRDGEKLVVLGRLLRRLLGFFYNLWNNIDDSMFSWSTATPFAALGGAVDARTLHKEAKLVVVLAVVA